MEEIEYLEEYEDLILPTIKSSTNAPKRPSTMANVPDDEDSSSIDQDIFESLFDDHSDDDNVPQKKAHPKFNQRRDERASMDSIDLLVKDLGEPPQNTRPRTEHSSAGNSSRSNPKAMSKERSATAKPGPIASTARADSSTRPEKPKSVATVRPTVQSQSQEKRTSSARTTTSSRAVSSTQNPTVLPVGSSMTKAGTSGLFALSSRKQISVATSTTTTLEAVRSGLITEAAKKPSRSQPTIIKPEKPQSRDPVEDPLSLDNINHESDSDSLSLSDISAESFVSLSDEDGRNIIELSNDSSLERANFDKIRGATPSPIVSEDNKSDKGESPGKLMLEVVTTAETTDNQTKISATTDEDVHTKASVVDHEEIIARCISPNASKCVVVTEFPEKAIVVSDTLLPRCDSVPLRATVTNDESKVTSSGKQSDDELVGSTKAGLSKSEVSTTEQEKTKRTKKADEASNAGSSSELSDSKKPFGKSAKGLALNNEKALKESDEGEVESNQPEENEKCSEENIEKSTLVVGSSVQTSADTNTKLSKTEVINEKHINREVIGKTGFSLENQESLPGSVEQCSQIINGGEANKSASGRKDKEAPTMQSETAQSNELVKRTKSIEASEEDKSLIDASCMAKESNPKEMSLNNQEINQTIQDGNRDKLNGKQDGCKENAKSIKRSQRKHESDDKNKPQSSGNSQEIHKNADLCEEEEANKVALHSDNEVKVVDVSVVKNAQSVVEKASTEDCDAKETDNKNLDAVKKSDDSSKEPESITERDISTKKHNEVNPEENQRGTRGNKMNKKAWEKNDTVRIPSEETQRDEVGTVIPTDFKKLEREKTNTSKEKSTEKPFETLESSQFEPQKQGTEDKKASDETKNSILEGPRDNCVQENEISMEQQLDKTTMNSNYSDANDEQDNQNLQSYRRVKKKKGNKNCAEENESTKSTAKCPATPAYEKTEYKSIAQGSIERAADSGCSSVKATDKSTTPLVNSFNQVENGNLSHNPEEDVLRRRSLRKRCAEQSPLNDVSKKIVKQPLSSGTVKPKAQTASATSPKRSTRSLVIQLQGKEESSDQKDKIKTEVKRKSARLPCDNMEGLTNLSKNESETSNAKKRCKSEAAQDHGSSLVNVNLRQKPSEESIAEIGPRPKVSQKSEKSILENKLENVTEKKMSAPKVDKTKFCEESAKMVKVKDKAEMTSLSHGSKRKLPQRKEKSMLAVGGGSPLKSKCDRADISEPPKKLSRPDLDLQASQKETERKKQEKTSENEKSRVVLNNSRTKKVFTALEESSPKFVRADKSSNDPLKIVKNCLDADHGVTLHLTPEKRTLRLKAIDERYPSNLATEHDVGNQAAPSKALPETQRKSLRAKAACTEKDRITEQNQDNTSPTQNSTEKSTNPEEEDQEPEKHVEKDARKGAQNPEVKTKSSQGDKDSSPTKKSKSSPKKSPGSTVITFKEWLNQRQFEDVEKGLEHLNEEHDDSHKSLEETNKEINKRSKNKADFSKNNTSTTHEANPESVSNTSNTKKIKTRSVRKSEVEVLKELKDPAVAMLLEEKHPRRMLKSGSSKTFPHITSPLAAGAKGELATTFSEKFKVPVTPQRLRGTPVRSLADKITNEVPHVSGSSTDGVDKAENRNKFYKKFKLRKLRVRMNRVSVTAYLRNLATQKPMSRTTDASSLESSTVPELDGTLGLTQSKTPLKAVFAAQSTAEKSAVTLTQKRVTLRTKPAPVISGPANVLTIPPHQRRALPLPTKPCTVTTRDKDSSVGACEPDSSQMDTSLLTPIKSSTVNTIAATVRKQPPLHQEERHQPDTRSAETEVVPPENSSAINELSSAAPFTPVEPKEEIVDEALNTAATPVGINSSTTRTVGSVVVSQSALSAAGTTFGVAPTVIDSNGTRLYSFLHPAKYQRSHGCVLLDYCCPNLDGPMPAIDPTRIHTQVQAAVRELPAYIVMTTKLITRADLEANKNVIPASIRQKVEKITANAVGNTSITSSVVPALPVSVPVQPAPLITPTISALQKQLPPTTTITPKILPSNPIGASNALTAKDTPLPPLTPFSAISNSHSIAPSSPILVEYQRSLLRSHLRQFDACLKKHYPRIGMLTFAKRQQVVEGVLSTTTLSAKDVEIAVRLLEEYAAQINSTASSMVPSGSQQQRLAQSNTTPKPKTTTARTPTATTATQQQQQHQLQQQLKRQVPIYDVYKNIIGYQLQMTAPSTGVTVTKSVMSARSEVMSTSANTKSASLSNVYAASTPTSALKSLTQESPRIFYAKPPLQTSTPIASSAGTTPMGSSITLRSAPRLNREITIRRVSPPNASSTITPPSVGRLPTLTRNPHLSAVITSAQRTSTTVTTQASVTMAPTSRRITRKTAATTAAKVIVVTQGHSQNDQSTTDECILPDDNNSPQIKHEKVDDDFISAN